MLDLFKGQITIDMLRNELSYKEALMLRDTRIKRLNKEREEIAKGDERTKAAHAQENIRKMIMGEL